jgi:hypothetical protein
METEKKEATTKDCSDIYRELMEYSSDLSAANLVASATLHRKNLRFTPLSPRTHSSIFRIVPYAMNIPETTFFSLVDMLGCVVVVLIRW